MPPTVVLRVLLLTWGCSILVQSSSEHTEANSTDSRDGGEVKLRVTRSDVRSTLAGKVEPGFWPARGRRGDPDELILPLITTKGGSLKYAVDGADLRDLIDLWKEESGHPNTLRLRRQEPLYADEPNYTLLGRRDEAEMLEKDGEASMMNPDDPFWVARGRRRLDRTMPFQSRLASDEDDTFWAARGRRASTRGLHNLISAEEPFWAARGRRSESFEEPFWPARGKKKSSSFTLEDFRNRRGFHSQGEEPFWAARGKKAGEKRARIPLMDALSSGEPFWAARGRRGLLESLSSEEPFWAARGKKNSGRPMEEPIKQDLKACRELCLQQSVLLNPGLLNLFMKMLPRENIPNSSADPWWPVRGKRVADESSNPEDEHFWNTLDSKTKSNKAS